MNRPKLEAALRNALHDAGIADHTYGLKSLPARLMARVVVNGRVIEDVFEVGIGQREKIENFKKRVLLAKAGQFDIEDSKIA